MDKNPTTFYELRCHWSEEAVQGENQIQQPNQQATSDLGILQLQDRQ